MSGFSKFFSAGLLSVAASAAHAQHAGHSMSSAPRPQTSAPSQEDSQSDSESSTSTPASQDQVDMSEAHSAHGPMHSEADATASEREHVPPARPQHEPPDMSSDKMIELMEMDDTASRTMILVNRLEYADANQDDLPSWDVLGWFGNDYSKLVAKSEGMRTTGEKETRNELLADRIVARYWSVQGGVRYDSLEGTDRTWAAIGLQGIAPYWFEVETTLYVGDGGRMAARVDVDYDMLLTQRLILQPELEVNAYSKSDPQNQIGSGISESELSLRLRYEFRREIAPYVGVLWRRAYGNTADFQRAEGADPDDVAFIAGIRVWY